MGALASYVEKVFGVKTRVEPCLITQATAAALLAFRNNPDRLMVVISNLGANAIYVGFDNSGLTTATGVHVDPNGGYISLIASEDGEILGSEIWIIGAGVSNLYALAIEAA